MEDMLNVMEEQEQDDFQIPEFLSEESTEEEIHKKMMDELPEDLDKSEGGFIYDLTRPTAIEISRIKEFELVETIKLIWPRFAEGIYLDYHGENRGLERKEAVNAKGELCITGKAGTVIPAGTIFMTEGVLEEVPKEYVTTEDVTIVENTVPVHVPVESIEAGVAGNCAAGTIILQGEFSENIETVTNESPITGGMEAEDDESFRERIMEYDQTQGDSYIGNYSDYKRWASSVEGVGSVTILVPEDDSGLIDIILTDANGEPASEMLCKEVYDYIMKPEEPENRLAPVNAKIRVYAQSTLPVKISAVVKLEDVNIETAQRNFASDLKNYLKETGNDGEIRYTQICKILANTEGIYDYTDVVLEMSGDLPVVLSQIGEKNIPVQPGTIPVVSEIILVEG